MAHPLLGEDSGSSETTARIAVYEEGKSTHKIWRSHPSVNNDPSICATLYTAGGVGELYQRRSTLLKSLHFADHHPIRIGDERGRLIAALPVIA
jgi:hypothetical protein